MRFGVPRILEFYAATEGSVSLYNCEGKPGAIGRVPPMLAHRFPVALLRCDAETGERPARSRRAAAFAVARTRSARRSASYWMRADRRRGGSTATPIRRPRAAQAASATSSPRAIAGSAPAI